MAESATLARPYANAVFAIAKSERALDRWSRILGLLAAAVRDPRVKQLLTSPDVSAEQKAHRLSDVCGDELTDKARKLILVLARNKRLGLLEDIEEQFEVLRAQEEQSLDVQVTSAYPLSDDQSDALQRSLAGKFAKEVSLTSSVDPDLIGGAVIRAGDTVIDGSLRGKLNKLAETLQRT